MLQLPRCKFGLPPSAQGCTIFYYSYLTNSCNHSASSSVVSNEFTLDDYIKGYDLLGLMVLKMAMRIIYSVLALAEDYPLRFRPIPFSDRSDGVQR